MAEFSRVLSIAEEVMGRLYADSMLLQAEVSALTTFAKEFGSFGEVVQQMAELMLEKLEEIDECHTAIEKKAEEADAVEKQEN